MFKLLRLNQESSLERKFCSRSREKSEIIKRIIQLKWVLPCGNVCKSLSFEKEDTNVRLKERIIKKSLGNAKICNLSNFNKIKKKIRLS